MMTSDTKQVLKQVVGIPAVTVLSVGATLGVYAVVAAFVVTGLIRGTKAWPK